jgi:glycosyltransferase involved in cell wall biosynthesis
MTVAVVAIVKNEALYIDEWLYFHTQQGIDKFFIYDNESTDNTLKILQEWESVHIIPWSIRPGQMAAYSDALRAFDGEARWLAFIDADEFLYSPTGRKIPDVMRDYEYAAAVGVHWKLFGSNGHTKYSPEPVVKRFTMRAEAINPHVKSIVQTGLDARVGNDPHSFRVNGCVVDEYHRQLETEYAVSENGTADILAINHYHTKSKAEYKKKCDIRRADTGTLRVNERVSFDTMFKAHDCNEVEDLYACNAYGVK